MLDIRARDGTGRWLNIEMQVSISSGLLRRMVYYACSMYVQQLEPGDNYGTLQPAISICLLSDVRFRDDSSKDVPHHRFRMTDIEDKREIADSIEVHTIELTKYNLDAATISLANPINQWAFFLLYADRYESAELRALLPGVDFQNAITVIESIAAKTEDQTMLTIVSKQNATLDGDRECPDGGT